MSFFIDTTGKETTTTPSFIKFNYENTEDTSEIEPPSFVNKILANISKLNENNVTTKASVKSVDTNISKIEQYQHIGRKKKGMQIIHKITDNILSESSKTDEVLKKSVITPGFHKLHSISQYDPSEKKLKAQRKLERSSTKGKKWYGLPATELTDEVKHDLEALQMRSVIDPKHFYKKNDMKVLPKYFQVGKVMDSPLDYYNNRCTKKERKRTLVDELLADAEFNKYNKKKYVEIIEERRKTHKAFRHAKKLKRKNK